MEINTNNLFITATRVQLRFANTRGGVLQTEDLWSLNLKTLDGMAVAVSNNIQAGATTFLERADTVANAAQEMDKLRLEILKFVITTKQDEAKAAKDAATKTAHKAFLKSLLDSKRMENLGKLTEKEIEEQIASLG